MKNQLTKTPYIVLFIILITVGVGTASALITITLSGNVVVTGDLDVQGNVTSPTVSDLQNQINVLGGSQVYEVSGVSIIPAGQTNTGSVVQLRCLEGDQFLNTNPLFSLTLDPSLDTTNLSVDLQTITPINENNAGVLGYARIIGYDVNTQQNGAFQLFEIPVTVAGFCLSP